ncbi:MAG: hypothetical protein JJT78_04400 [Leptospira sp.]|nr:hypothetical protein [Leptospira sp.]
MISKYFKIAILILLTHAYSNCMQFDDKSADAELYRMIGNLALAQSLSGSTNTTRVQDISMGRNFTCALLENGTVRCWGDAAYGRLGMGDRISINDATMARTIPFAEPVVKIQSNEYSTCALLESGNLKCWGGDDPMDLSFSLGYGMQNSIDDPVSAPDYGFGARVIDFALGRGYACVVLEGNFLRCWGHNDDGQLGIGNNDSVGLAVNATPNNLVEITITSQVTKIFSGLRSSHNCLVNNGGAGWCWGSGFNFQLGNNISASIESINNGNPLNLPTIKEIINGQDRTCALLETGNLSCWGNVENFGYGTDYENILESNQFILDLGKKASHITLGFFMDDGNGHAGCLTFEDGSGRCWGDNYDISPALGIGSFESLPQDYNLTDIKDLVLQQGRRFEKIRSSGSHSCAVMENGAVRCWGYGNRGRLGYGDEGNVMSPFVAKDIFLPAQ